MRRLLSLLCVATAVALAAFAAPQALASDGITMRTVFLDEDAGGPAVLHISDNYRIRPQGEVIVFTYEHPRRTYHFNSIKEKLQAFDAHLRSNVEDRRVELIAISQEKPHFKVFIHPPVGFDMDTFEYPQTTVRFATDEELATLASIETRHFSAYFVAAYDERQKAQRFVFGDRIKGKDTVETRVQITGENRNSARQIERALKSEAFDMGFEPKVEREGNVITASSQFEYDETKVRGFYKVYCTLAATEGGECTDWKMNVQPRRVTLEDFLGK